MKLTDTAIRKAKYNPTGKGNRLFDGGGLYVELSPAGGKLWRQKYRFGGKEKLLSFGTYPHVSLVDARERREDAKKLLANGQDPSAVKQTQKAAKLELSANSFEVVTREWFAVWSPTKAPSHASKVIARLEKDAFPWLGKRPIAEITAPDVLAILRRIESRGVIETAHRVKQSISQVMCFAIATGKRTDTDPCLSLRGALKTAVPKHMAAITDPIKAGALLRAIDGYKGGYIVRAALALAPLFFVRPGELAAAKWEEFDLEKAEWRFTTSKTKTPHLVPLATQAIAILRDLHPLTGAGEYVFPGRDKPITREALTGAIRRMGFCTKTDHTTHGFRTMARTMLVEEMKADPEWIERQLSHKIPDKTRRAYDRTKHIDERRTMMQQWADYLDKLKAGAEVIQLRA